MDATKVFRYDIAFLRAIAILSVVLYHLGIPYAKEGFVGVDIFFVLSGYLMTKIILGDIKLNRFRLLKFYKRRAIRILPALLLLIVFFYIILYLVLGIKLYDFSRFALSSTLFVSNVYYELSSGYFQPASQLNFLLHTWSLSIEAQFYIVYPIFLLLYQKLVPQASRYAIYFLYTLFAISLCCMFYSGERSQSFAFYMFHTRAWELLAGSLVFFHEKPCRRLLSLPIRRGIALLCIAVLLVSITGLFGLRYSGWPSGFTLIPVVATCSLLIVNSNLKVFQLPAVKFVADISYSWYLWHWPLIVLGTYFSLNGHWWFILLIFVLSFICGVFSFRYIETSKFLLNPIAALSTATLVVIISFLGTQIPLHKLFINPQEANLIAFHYRYPRECAAAQYGFGKTHLLSRHGFDDFDTAHLFRFSDRNPNYLLLGDCHAGMFAHTLRKLALTNQINLLQATGDDVFPAPKVKPIYRGPTELMHYIYEQYLPQQHHRIDKVILSANYASYSKKELTTYLKAVEAYFSKLNIPVLYIGQTEGYRIEYPVIETLQLKFNIQPTNYLQSYRGRANDFIKQSRISDNYIDVYKSPLVQSTDGVQSYMYDADHFAIYGTEQYIDVFQEKIFSK